jgi:hypothetical protein
MAASGNDGMQLLLTRPHTAARCDLRCECAPSDFCIILPWNSDLLRPREILRAVAPRKTTIVCPRISKSTLLAVDGSSFFTLSTRLCGGRGQGEGGICYCPVLNLIAPIRSTSGSTPGSQALLGDPPVAKLRFAPWHQGWIEVHDAPSAEPRSRASQGRRSQAELGNERKRGPAKQRLPTFFHFRPFFISRSGHCAAAYAERDIVSRIDALLARLEHAPEESIDDDVRDKLEQLIERAKAILEAAQ